MDAWKRDGLRTLKRYAKQALICLKHRGCRAPQHVVSWKLDSYPRPPMESTTDCIPAEAQPRCQL